MNKFSINRLWILILMFGCLFVKVEALMQKPRSLVVKSNQIYILDGAKRTWMFGLQKYDSTGHHLSTINTIMLHFDWGEIKRNESVLSPAEILKKYSDVVQYLRIESSAKAILDKVFYPDYICNGYQNNLYAIGVGTDTGSRCRAAIIDSNDGHTILAFGEFTREDTQYGLWNPLGIAADSQGNMYIANQGPYCVKKFDKNGQYVTKWGKRGNKDGEFANPVAIAVDKRNDNVYVVDSYASWNTMPQKRVQKFTKDGRFLGKWGEHFGLDWVSMEYIPISYPVLTNISDLNIPAGIAIDSKGNVYVVESGKDGVSKFDENGHLILSFGGTGSGLGQFNMPGTLNVPVGIAIDKDDNVYVCDEGNDRVQKFNENGKFLMEIK